MARAKGFEPATFTLATCGSGLKLRVRIGGVPSKDAAAKVCVGGRLPAVAGHGAKVSTEPALAWGRRRHSQGIAELLAAKPNGNKTSRYLTSKGYCLRQFAAGRENQSISDFTFLDVEQWLAR
jgi:hypothetical protein